jgi:hypothetical protein
MANEPEMAAFVEKAAAKFADAEKKCETAYKAVLALAPLMAEGAGLGLAGYLQSSRMKQDLRVAGGDIAHGLAIVFSVHGEGTQLAQDKNVDLPQVLDGGGHR